MKNNFYQNVGSKIKSLRQEKKVSQRYLAEALGKNSSTYINLIESGKRKVGLEKLIQISEALKVDFNVFIEKEDHQLDAEALLKLALNSQDGLSQRQREMIIEMVHFFKQKDR